MKKTYRFLKGLPLVPSLMICFAGFAQEAMAEGLYNAREELEYTRHASQNREDEQRQKIQFLRYQQQQYLEHERLMNQQSMYDQAHHRKSDLSQALMWER